MLRRAYAFLGRALHAAARPFLRRYFAARHVRVRALVLNEQGELLLTRSWFGHQKWSLPGGGIGHRETSAQAASREVLEETGVHISPQQFSSLGRFANGDSSAPFTVDAVVAHIKNQPAGVAKLRRLEIVDTAWFPLHDVPPQRSKTVDRALALNRGKPRS